MTKWDISGMGAWKAEDFPRAAIIPEAGNSNDYITGGWRSERPVRDEGACTHCLLCWIYCPDAAIRVAEGKVTEFDYDHCKGCGICVHECVTGCIRMVEETE